MESEKQEEEKLKLIQRLTHCPVVLGQVPALYGELMVRFAQSPALETEGVEILLPWRIRGLIERVDSDGRPYLEITCYDQDCVVVRAYLATGTRPQDAPPIRQGIRTPSHSIPIPTVAS